MPSDELVEPEGPPPAQAVAPGPVTPAPRRIRPYQRIVVEVVLITLGVFLALLADGWRERAQHRELADDTLRRFRTEFVSNREAVAAVDDKHVDSLKTIRAYFESDGKTQPYPYLSTSPAFLEYTAWDLAIATQALSYVDADLAQAVAHVYAVQRQLDAATRDITLVMYARSGDADPQPLTRSLATYFGDCALIEPRLLALYDAILPRLDAALSR